MSIVMSKEDIEDVKTESYNNGYEEGYDTGVLDTKEEIESDVSKLWPYNEDIKKVISDLLYVIHGGQIDSYFVKDVYMRTDKLLDQFKV